MKNLTLLLFTILAIAAQATSPAKQQDILYLKSGGIIYGTIKDRADKIKIQISGGSIMVYRLDEIDSMKQEPLNKALRRDFWANYYRKNKGFRNITEVQFTYGPRPALYNYDFLDQYDYYGSGTDDVGVGVHTINGYQCGANFFIGGGVGVDRLLTFRETYIPLYVRLQTELLKTRITPYLFGDIGYAFFIADQVSNTRDFSYYHRIGGLYFTLGGGIHFYTKGPVSYMIGAGYRRNYSEVKYGYDDGNGNVENKNMYQRLVVSWGLTF